MIGEKNTLLDFFSFECFTSVFFVLRYKETQFVTQISLNILNVSTLLYFAVFRAVLHLVYFDRWFNAWLDNRQHILTKTGLGTPSGLFSPWNFFKLLCLQNFDSFICVALHPENNVTRSVNSHLRKYKAFYKQTAAACYQSSISVFPNRLF